MILSCTGHRPDKLNNEWNGGPISEWIRVKIWSGLHRHKPEAIISGMALGVDMIWAEVGLAFNIPVFAYIPCLDQEKKWSSEQQERYHNILSKCYKIVQCTNKRYFPECMQIRNEMMVDDSDALVAVWNGSEGGTKNCYDYARTKGKTIYRIGPKFGR